MSLAAVRRKLSRFRALGGSERRLLVRAALWLPAVDLGLRTVGFARVRRRLERPGREPADGPVTPERWAEAESIARLVVAAARHHLYPMTCLRRALVLERLLAERGIPSRLRIGVRKDAQGFRAHAWVECDGRALSEPEAVESRFAALSIP